MTIGTTLQSLGEYMGRRIEPIDFLFEGNTSDLMEEDDNMKTKKMLDKIYKKADRIDELTKKVSMCCDEIKDLVSDLEEGKESLSKQTDNEYGPWKGNL